MEKRSFKEKLEIIRNIIRESLPGNAAIIALIYAIPYALYALAAGFLVTFFSVPNVRINIRKYRDIPAEMSYAPGEHIKGGQE